MVGYEKYGGGAIARARLAKGCIIYGARSLVMHIASARATGPGFMILVSNFVSNFVKIGVRTCKIA